MVDVGKNTSPCFHGEGILCIMEVSNILPSGARIKESWKKKEKDSNMKINEK